MKGSSRVQIFFNPEFTSKEYVPGRSLLSCLYYIRSHCSRHCYFWYVAWGEVNQ